MSNANIESFITDVKAQASADADILAVAAPERMALRYLTQIEDTHDRS